MADPNLPVLFSKTELFMVKDFVFNAPPLALAALFANTQLSIVIKLQVLSIAPPFVVLPFINVKLVNLIIWFVFWSLNNPTEFSPSNIVLFLFSPVKVILSVNFLVLVVRVFWKL